MLVADLIEQLQELPPYYEVIIAFGNVDKYGFYDEVAYVNGININDRDKAVIIK